MHARTCVQHTSTRLWVKSLMQTAAAYLGKGAPAQKHGEGVAARVLFIGLQDLHRLILQEVVHPVRAPVAIQAAPVIPDAVEAQHLTSTTATRIAKAKQVIVFLSWHDRMQMHG